MSLASSLLERFPAGRIAIAEPREQPSHGDPSPGDPSLDHRVLALGNAAIDRALPGGGLLRGAVTEFAVCGASGKATTLALLACRAVLLEQGRDPSTATDDPLKDRPAREEPIDERAWCVFIDPSKTLSAVGVSQLGVDLRRLLVVRPPPEALARTALRIVEGQRFELVVIDTLGVTGKRLSTVSLKDWVRVVRKMNLLVAGTRTCILLITDASLPRALPLPVATRLELKSTSSQLTLQVVRDQFGRLANPMKIKWPEARAKYV